jgi:hypothetical protein
MNSIINPINNQPYNIVIEQAADLTYSNIIGFNQQAVTMKYFDPITITSAIRDISKIGAATNINIFIKAPNYKDALVISFPKSQFINNTACQVIANAQQLPCQYINSSAILTENL